MKISFWKTDEQDFDAFEVPMGFELVESSVLKVYRATILGLANHYYLAENADFNHSLGWGAKGLELRGSVKITPQELERVKQFMFASQYNVEVHNCEHFANYILYGINFSAQENVWWKGLSAKIISLLQPVHSVGKNYNSLMEQQITDVLKEGLRAIQIEKAEQERREFWQHRGIDVQ